jgi:hypothetical protein
MEEKINSIKVLNTLDNAINRLTEGFNPELLTEAEREDIEEQLDDVIHFSLKEKLQYQQRRIESIIKSLYEDKTVNIAQVQTNSKAL